MDQLYKFVKKFFFLTPVKTVIIAIPSYLFVIFVLVNNIQNVAISSVAYVLSAYALIITITGIIRIVQFVHQSREVHSLLKKIVSIPIIGRLIKENTFRTQIALYPGFLINVVYVIWKLSFGIYYNGVIIQTADRIKEINCESVILSVGYTPNPLCEKSEHIHVIGDAAKVGNLKTVIWGAYDLAFSL